MRPAFVVGIDFGTNSVRAIVVSCEDGREVGEAVFNYPSGDHGVLLHPRDPHLARQNPADYIEGAARIRHRRARRGVARSGVRAPSRDRHRCRHDGIDAAADRRGGAAARDRPALARQPRRPRVAVEGPHGRGRGGGHHRCGARARAVPARADRRHLLLGVVVVEDLALPEGRARRLRCRRELGGARRLRARRSRRSQRASPDRALHLRGGPQGAVRRRVGRPSAGRVPRDARSQARGVRDRASTTARCRPAPPRDTSAASGRRHWICRKASRSRWARSTRTTRPLAPASGPARSSRSSARRPATARCCR